ncbi:MAG TPA: DUF1778 domain-containing protein [Pseudoalteromonas sp.]|nr:DUF1778 domain-containing protein [Pseudoalteromonas sp.]|tara:strand:+ start:4259 stop:4543 length:285 start_codon:yes stop_codon:yes gene_type:complete
MHKSIEPVSGMNRHARIDIKTSHDVKKQLEEAASESGLSLTAFILNQAVESARELLRDREVTRLNKTAWAALNRAIASPAPANDALRELMKEER